MHLEIELVFLASIWVHDRQLSNVDFKLDLKNMVDHCNLRNNDIPKFEIIVINSKIYFRLLLKILIFSLVGDKQMMLLIFNGRP